MDDGQGPIYRRLQHDDDHGESGHGGSIRLIPKLESQTPWRGMQSYASICSYAWRLKDILYLSICTYVGNEGPSTPHPSVEDLSCWEETDRLENVPPHTLRNLLVSQKRIIQSIFDVEAMSEVSPE